MTFRRAILAHGGAGSDPKDSDGTLLAATIGLDQMKAGASGLDAVVKAVRYLESDPRFNAGFGSQIREDGQTVQLDASCMQSDGKFGAVACVENLQNPIDLAHGVLTDSPHILIVGEGARIFAQTKKIRSIPFPSTDLDCASPPSCDTVGAVAYDGKQFAAALSSGGLEKSPIGRVGDVPLPGCGLFCGSSGAIACTGDGEFIALKILAREVYGWVNEGLSPAKSSQRAIDLFDVSVDIGLIIVTKNEFAAQARSGMAVSHLTEENE